MPSYAEYLVKKVTSEYKEKRHAEHSEERFVRWLSELNKDSIPIAGGKGANLAEMFNSGFPVPPAFVITAQAYSHFLKANHLDDKIKEIIEEINIDKTTELEIGAKKIRDLIIESNIPEEMQSEITEAYSNLNVDPDIIKSAATDVMNIIKVAREPCFVAVRSSATTEDLKTASFAGQQESFLNIKGKEELVIAIKKCLASLFTARAIYYREKNGFAHEKALLSVVVQRMINSEKSGVIFTINPMNDNDEIVMEAVFGLGEGIVSGTIMPDHYVIEKKYITITEKSIGTKEEYFTRTGTGKNIREKLQDSKKIAQVLTDSEIKQLSNYAINIESHYKHPQDIEFAIENNHIYIVQSRPITTMGKKKERSEINAALILQGLPASPGIANGRVKIVHSMDDLNKVEKGDVLVTKMTNPDMVVTMQRAAAIVTDEGGATAHAAIVSREMGIPCVVGTKKATSLLQDGKMITVDGFEGRVYEGKTAEQKAVEILPVVKTRTKIKVLVDLPNFAERAAKTQAAGIGLVRLEGIIASSRKHPLQYLKENNLAAYEQLIYDGLSRIARFFQGKPIWVRTSDIRSDEFQDLQGAPELEKNPMLGLHGIRASLKNQTLFKAELKAVKRVAEEGAHIEIMLPQIISVEELKKTKSLMQSLGMNIGIGAMIETPAAVEIIEDLCKEIIFISFGTNDLTQYTLATDRGNESIQDLYNEMHPAVLSQMSRVIRACRAHGVESSICGQAGSKPEMAKFLVREGIDSISVNADMANAISKVVAETESELQKSIYEPVEMPKINNNSSNVKLVHDIERHEEAREAGLGYHPSSD